MHYCGRQQTSQNWLISTRRKGDFECSGCQQHLPQNLGYTEGYQQTKCIFISPISTLFRTESLKEIENLIKIEWSKITRTATSNLRPPDVKTEFPLNLPVPGVSTDYTPPSPFPPCTLLSKSYDQPYFPVLLFITR